MKRLILIIIGVLLCAPLYSDMNTYVIGSGVEAGELTCTAWITEDNAATSTAERAEQSIEDPAGAAICRIDLKFNNTDGANDCSVVLQLWSGCGGTGTQYGGNSTSQTITHGAGVNWKTFEWSSDWPEPAGAFYIHPVKTGSGEALVEYGGDNYAGGNLYSNACVSYTSYDANMIIYTRQ